ncbi:unnamed protein product [Brassica oleracea var. botrytis]
MDCTCGFFEVSIYLGMRVNQEIHYHPKLVLCWRF